MALICSESPQAQVAPLYYDNEEEKWILAPAFDKHLQLSAQLPTDIPAPSSLRFPEPQQPTGSWAHMAKPTAYGLLRSAPVYLYDLFGMQAFIQNPKSPPPIARQAKSAENPLLHQPPLHSIHHWRARLLLLPSLGRKNDALALMAHDFSVAC